MSVSVLEIAINVQENQKLTENLVLSAKDQASALTVTERGEYSLINIDHSFRADSLASFMIIFINSSKSL